MIREGYIEKIKYQSEDTAYCVLIVDGPEGEEIFVGDIAGAAEGVYIQARVSIPIIQCMICSSR